MPALHNISSHEEWKPVAGWEGVYAVSSTGQVKRIAMSKGTRPLHPLLKPRQTKCGYRSVVLQCHGMKKQVLVHRVVAEAFIGTIPLGLEVNHRDGDKANNAAENLEYVSRSRNMKHAFEMGLHDRRGERNPIAKVTDGLVRIIRKRHSFGEKCIDIASDLKLSEGCVGDIIRRNAWKHVD